MEEGLVIKNTGSWYVVKTTDGDLVNSKIKGNFRIRGIRTTNPVAVGDRVMIDVNADGTALITAIEPRRNYIIRRASNLSKEAHILAANLDQALLVVSLCDPLTNTIFIDRFLATAEAYRVPVVIIVNKVDLLDDEMKEYLAGFKYLYESLGYEVITMSACGECDAQIERIKSLARDKVSLISGNSGVGKSTIINRVIPGLNLRVGEVSAVHHTGMHTTTFSGMYELPSGGYLIDTPGVKGFGTVDFESNAAHYFREIFAESAHCRYGNCTHTHEPGCAVIEAVADHRISQSRYASYLSVLEDATDSKYRKPF